MTASIAAMLALLVVGATPPKQQPEARVIRVAEIDRDSVRVKTAEGRTGAQLSFLWRDKDAQQARSFFSKGKGERARILDGTAVITEAKLWGVAESEAGKKTRGGLILWFDTIEEATRVATVLRRFSK